MQVDNTSTDRRSFSNIARTQVRNESKTLYTNPNYAELLDHPRELKVWRRSFNSKNVVFYTQPNIDKTTFLHECIKQIGKVTAITRMRNKRKENSYEVLFETTTAREVALSTINNVQLIAQPILDPNVSLTKVNLYNIPNASTDEIIKPIGEALSAFGTVAQIRAYLIPDVHVFDGQATVLIDTKSNGTDKFQQLTRQIHLGYDFDCLIQVRWKDMPSFCRYCRQEGHFKKNCSLLEQVKQQQQAQQPFTLTSQPQQQDEPQIQPQQQIQQQQQMNVDPTMDYSSSAQQQQPSAMDVAPSQVIEELSSTNATNTSTNNNNMEISVNKASSMSTEAPSDINYITNTIQQPSTTGNNSLVEQSTPYITKLGRVVQPPRPYSPSQYN